MERSPTLLGGFIVDAAEDDREAQRRSASEEATPRRYGGDPRGEFLIGSADFYLEKAPAHRVCVDGFWSTGRR
jgi:hypothetical protein